MSINKPIDILRLDFDDNDIQWISERIKNSLSIGQLTMGENVELLEKEFASFIGTKYAIGTNSGTSALEIIFRCLDVENKDVIIPSNTFIATAYAAMAAGGNLVFADCNPETLCLDPIDLKKRISKNTAAVTIVHIGGIITPEIYDIKKICDEYGIPLIEDAAHAHGSHLGKLRAGAIGTASAFSFYPTKVMTACEGGMITVDHKKYNELGRKLRVFGQESRYMHTHYGSNWRLSELHAIVALNQLSRLNERLEKRKKIARMYDDYISNNPNVTNYSTAQNQGSSFYKYVIKIKNKTYDDLKPLFKKYNIDIPGKVYDMPLHKQPVFSSMTDQKLPGAEQACVEHICLPMYPKLSDNEVAYVIDVVSKVS